MLDLNFSELLPCDWLMRVWTGKQMYLSVSQCKILPRAGKWEHVSAQTLPLNPIKSRLLYKTEKMYVGTDLI